MYYFVYASVNAVLVVSLVAALALVFVDKQLVASGMVFFYLNIYAIDGIYRLYVFMGGERQFNIMEGLLLTSLLLTALLVCKDRQRALFRGCLVSQLFIPAVLLIYTASKYMYQDEIMLVSVPVQVKGFIYILAAVFLIEAGLYMKKYWKKIVNIGDSISFGACVSIMAFNRFSGTGAVMPTDMHHPFENIIGYSQIFELGQAPFTEYIPVSGMYSVAQGAVFQLFGQGQMGSYHITQNIFYLLVILIIIALLRVQLSGGYVLAASLLLLVSDYNRTAFILPIMLLLMMPGLVKRKNLWLQVWFLTSLFHGLYYPLFGAAVCIAFLPLGIWQAVTWVKSGQYKTEWKKIQVWGGWLLCFLALTACIPCLSGTYRHMKAMAEQTVYADGISRFGQMVPSWFFPYLEDYSAVRIALYDAATFMIPAGFVWIVFALALKVGKVSVSSKRLQIQDKQRAAVVISLAIVLAVSLSSTIVRLDIGSLYARSAGVLYAGAILLLVVMDRYLGCTKIRYAAACVAVFIPAVVNAAGIFSLDSRLSAYYEVPEDYVYVQNDLVQRLGTGFISQDLYDSIQSVYTDYEGKDAQRSYLGNLGQFGYFYLCGVKGNGTIETMTITGYDAVQEAIDTARRSGAAITGNISSFYSYYLYHWLLTSGEYLWSDEEGCFLPNEGATVDEVRSRHKELALCGKEVHVGKNASSLGLSLDSLMEVLSLRDIGVTVQKNGNGIQVVFEEELSGDEADFMYIEFPEMKDNFQYTLFNLGGEVEQEAGALDKLLMKKNYNPGMQVRVEWPDEKDGAHSIICSMSEGKLLVPLGAGLNWLLDKHAYLNVSAFYGEQETALPAVKEIRFLKLREAGRNEQSQ